MAAEKMIDADGLVLVGADGLTLLSDANGQCGECCGSADPCVKPADVTQCAALYVFADPDQMFWSLNRTCVMRMSAGVSWGSRGGAADGDILGYRLYAPMTAADETIPLGPIFERDAGGCLRLVGFKGPAVLLVFQAAAAGNGASTTRVLNVCVTARMTRSGWTIELDFVDAADAGWVFTCTRPPAVWALDGAGGVVNVAGTQHTSTLVYAGDDDALNGGRAMVSDQVEGRLALSADYNTAGAGPNEPGCPPEDPGPYVIVVRPAFDTQFQREVACQPGVVIVPGRFRIRLEAHYLSRYNATSSTGSAVNRSQYDWVIALEYRAPRTVSELDVVDVGSFRHSLEYSDAFGTTEVTEQGVFWNLQTSSAASVLSGLFGGHVQGIADPVLGGLGTRGFGLLSGFNRVRAGIPSLLFMPCGGSVSEVETYNGASDSSRWAWSGSNSLTRRNMSQTFTRDFQGTTSTSHRETTLTATVSVEPIDVLVCEGANGGRVLPAMPSVRTLSDVRAAVGALLRGGE